MMTSQKIQNVVKVLFVIFFVLGLIAKYVTNSELVEDISFYGVTLFFMYFVLFAGKDGKKND